MELHTWFLAGWAKRMSWMEVARILQTSWASVFRAVDTVVEWGVARMSLVGLSAVGIDEVPWHRGPKYLPVVYDISATCGRLRCVGQHREEATLRAFFDWLGTKRTEQLKFVCSDMWKPYLRVIGEKATGALQVLDRFHSGNDEQGNRRGEGQGGPPAQGRR